MYDRETTYNQITDTSMGKVCKVLQAHAIPYSLDLLNGLGEIVCDTTLAALHAGEDCFTYKVCERYSKVHIDGGTLPEDIPTTHYFWGTIAGFTDEAIAGAFMEQCKKGSPSRFYGLFVNGVPVLYDE